MDPASTGNPRGDSAWMDEVRFDADGLVPAIAQEASTDRILMVAWMNREALAETVATGRAVYWSRSRGRLWHKGEESGHQQVVHAIRIDCDADCILIRVEQTGGACHTGYRSCFYRSLENGSWTVTGEKVFDADKVYRRD